MKKKNETFKMINRNKKKHSCKMDKLDMECTFMEAYEDVPFRSNGDGNCH